MCHLTYAKNSNSNTSSLHYATHDIPIEVVYSTSRNETHPLYKTGVLNSSHALILEGMMDIPTLNKPGHAGFRRERTEDVTTTPLSAGPDADLTPWSPTGEDPWDAAKAAHLLRRSGFGLSSQAIDSLLTSDPATLITAMLAPTPAPEPPGNWTTQQPFPTMGNAQLQQYAIWGRELQEWWFTLMEKPEFGLREKMTLFWHNHFTSEFSVVYVAQYFYLQNKLFRDYAFGSFKELTSKVTVDPCMLRYLDLGLSVAGNPNENYPREILELFCIGEGTYLDGTPHYTEFDIVELSRALTGWVVDGLQGTFRSTRFDSGQKTIFGQKANFGLGNGGDRDVIEWIFDQTDLDYNHKRSAIFLCSKLYRWFVYDVPNMEIVAGMADTLVANNWEVGPVLHQLLTSKHFFSEDVRGAMIKSPADYVAGAVNSFGLNPDISTTGVNINRPDTHDPITAMNSLAMTLLSPPNVKGWPGGRTWISSVTLPQRIDYAAKWVAPISGSRDYKFDPVAFLNTIPERDDVHAVLGRLLILLLPIPVGDAMEERLLNTLLGGAPDYEWDPDHPSTTQRLRSTLVEITRLAEYQLM